MKEMSIIRLSRQLRVLVLGLAAWGLLGGMAQAAFVVVPNALANTEGDSNNGFPFNIANFQLSSQRYQQAFASSQFPAGPELITQITFRPDAGTGAAFAATLPNVRIDLSTTALAPDALSSTFANNVGANDATVFSGALSLSSSFTGPAGGPKDFDIVINLTTPFLYNPAAGNLLLDVRNIGGGRTTQFDATTTTPGGTTSRVYTITSNGVNDPTGTVNAGGLVTRFTVGPAGPVAPEPSSVMLLGLGTVGMAGYGWRRRTPKRA
jgi:hypothetical protein